MIILAANYKEMNSDSLYRLRYPIGEFISPENPDKSLIDSYIATIEKLPARLRLEVAGLNELQLDTPYRPDGWSVRQVVHHLADSHMNSYCRFKLTVTESKPAIKPYLEELWAVTEDGKNAPVWMSLNLLDALHHRWIIFLRSLTPDQLERTYFHPQNNKFFNLKVALALYAWHGDHHLAHITELKKIKNWD